MLVQERPEGLRLIRQNDHALFAGRLAQEWVGVGERPVPLPFRAICAVALHDLAWAAVDAEPEWDDDAKRPRSFDTVTDAYRAALYASGLDKLERIDPYAALIGSFHYARFLLGHSGFLAAEEQRRERITAMLPSEFTRPEDLGEHAALLRHLDFLSLYLLLGDPGGRGAPEWLDASRVGQTAPGAPLSLHWRDAATIVIQPFPFRRPFSVSARGRDLPGDLHSGVELREAWARANPRDVAVKLQPS